MSTCPSRQRSPWPGGRDQGHGHGGLDDPRGPAGGAGHRRAGRLLQLPPDPGPAHPADHRHPVLELPGPVDAIAYGRGLRIKPPLLLADFTTAQVAGVPCSPLRHPAHRRDGRGPAPTVYGRWVVAIGQNIRAAHLAGVDVARTRCHLRHERCVRRPVRLSAVGLLRRRLAQHGRGVPADLDRRGRHRRPRSPAASPMSPACGVPRCSCSWS